MILDAMLKGMPVGARSRVEEAIDNISTVLQMRNPKVFTSMAPSIVFEGDKPRFVVGAPGGTYIAMGVLQAILNHIDFGMDAQQAVSAPRFSATSDIIEIVNRIPRAVEATLNDQGYRTRRYPINYHFAGVHAIRIQDGKLDGGADPGRDGMALST